MSLDTIRALVEASPHQEIVGLIGENPSKYSNSRIMWNALFAMYGIDMEYIPLDVENPAEVPAVLDYLLANKKVRGFNITNPHKESTALRPEIEVDKEAKATGGVNTVYRANEKLFAHSTDGYGIVTSIEENMFPGCLKGRQVLVLGAGSTGSAAAIACAKEGGHVVVTNRTYEKAKELERRANNYGLVVKPISMFAEGTEGLKEPVISSNLRLEMLLNASIIINAIDEKKSGQIFSDELFKREPNWVDVYLNAAYGGQESPFLESAKRAGHYITLAGGWMLLHQGIRAAEYICAPEIATLGLNRAQITAPMRYAITQEKESKWKFNKPNEEIAREILAKREEILKLIK